jgi:hypothetical protein
VLWLSLALTAVAVTVGLRWTVTRVDALGRSRPFPLISVVACTVAAMACAVPALLHARLESRLSAAASEVAGEPVQVHCQTLGQSWVDAHTELGYVEVGADGRPAPRTVIAVRACDDLSGWLHSDRGHPSLAELVAVHVLTHESMHMAGELTEARAECAAVQRDARMARALGAGPEQALALARWYWQLVYPDLPDDYRSSDCRPGGALDEHLPGAPWQQVG